MRYALECIKKISKLTNEVILFHSGTGKDSIALLDLAYPHFGKIVCVYMYMVKDLEHIDKYILWAKYKYPKIQFIQVPHYALSQYRRDGVLGCKRDPEQRIYNLNHITGMVKRNTGIDWALFGFKQSDSLNRRLMLRGYEDESIYHETKNAYPLSRYKNQDVLKYIKYKKLVQPISYGHGQSQGTDVSNIPFLLYCKELYPRDYEKILNDFPHAERIVYNFENYAEKYGN